MMITSHWKGAHQCTCAQGRSRAGGEHANGYTFTGMDEGSLNSALDRALTAFTCAPVRCCMGSPE